MKLKIEGLDFAYKAGSPVLREVTMEALPGQITALIGPNASGKSTLIKCIAGLLKASGKIMFGSRDTRDIPKAERSRLTGYLPQELPARAILTVFEAILIGRLNSLSWRVSQDDLEKAFDVLSFMGIQDLATRFLSELSGGQKQIVSIAQTLAGEPEIMLLDEPTSNLDLRHEIEVLEIIQNDT